MLFALWLTISALQFGLILPAFATSTDSTVKIGNSSLPLQNKTTVFKWAPTHNQIWGGTVQNHAPKQYADWDTRNVTVYQPTSCGENAEADWTIASLNLYGQVTTTGPFTRIAIDLPPYINDFKLLITCADTSVETSWTRNVSLPIPTLYWKQSTDGSFETILHNGQSLSIHIAIQQHPYDDWQELIALPASHPLEMWSLPILKTKQIRLTLMDGKTALFEHDSATFRSWIEPGTTFSSDNPIRIELVERIMTQVHIPVHDVQSTDFYRKHLEYTPTVKGLHWLEQSTVHNTSLDPFWVYDGVWNWFDTPIWETSNVHHLFTVRAPLDAQNHIPFLRWNDTILLESRSWQDGVVKSSSQWVHGTPYQDATHPLLISPEDQLHYHTDTLSLLNSHLTTDVHTIDVLSTIDSSQQFFRTGVQANDDRLSSLLPFIFTPLTPQQSARILHSIALFWNPLHTRDLPWFQELLNTANQAQQMLEGLSDTDWNALDVETRLFIVWASLVADNEGLSPSSKMMRRNLDWLCSLDNTETDDTAMLVSHLRWMITQSYWKHRSCNNTHPINIIDHPSAKPHIKTIESTLKESWERQSLAILSPDASEWMHWILLEQEQHFKERYVNLNLSLHSESTSDRGLFHEWQIRPLKTTLDTSRTTGLSVKGIGRLYTSVWVPTSTSFADHNGVYVQVQREIFTAEGAPLNPQECEQGQRIQIQTRVRTTPNTQFCIRQWNAVGLANHHMTESHFCTTSDANGQWSQTTHTHVVFEGRFRLPSTFVATKNDSAHTKTTWFETRQYKELMP